MRSDRRILSDARRLLFFPCNAVRSHTQASRAMPVIIEADRRAAMRVNAAKSEARSAAARVVPYKLERAARQ